MRKFSSISFFCPAYNDEKNIQIVIEEADKLLKKWALKYEIIVVNDCSPDNTRKVVERLLKKYKNLKLINHDKNQGYGGALKTGFKKTKYDYVIYTDGDNQYNVSEFGKLFILIENSDIVAGYVDKKATSFKRKIQSIVYNSLIFLLFGIAFKDINCSMKMIKRKVLDSIQINSDSAFIDAEIIIKAIRKNYKIKRCNVTHKPRLNGIEGGSKPKVIIGTIYEMFKFRFGKL